MQAVILLRMPIRLLQAKEDISEDGYWGVNQTSDRIFSFALALSNGDEKQMEKMVKAVEKGFSLATKSWGQELPFYFKRYAQRHYG